MYHSFIHFQQQASNERLPYKESSQLHFCTLMGNHVPWEFNSICKSIVVYIILVTQFVIMLGYQQNRVMGTCLLNDTEFVKILILICGMFAIHIMLLYTFQQGLFLKTHYGT